MNHKIYYYILIENKYINSEPIEEVFRERLNNYFFNKKIIDFWIIFVDKMLDNKIKSKILSKNKNIEINNFVCLFSSNIKFIEWLKLRLGFSSEINSFDIS
jgi:hypothetical protein